uniref:Uncharacterized protein n=1 Tax=Strigamia maritima TaxID=126957 RepID=T1J2Z7_STRMM
MSSALGTASISQRQKQTPASLNTPNECSFISKRNSWRIEPDGRDVIFNFRVDQTVSLKR